MLSVDRVKAKAKALAYLEAKAKANTGVLHYVQDDGGERVRAVYIPPGRCGAGRSCGQVDLGER